MQERWAVLPRLKLDSRQCPYTYSRQTARVIATTRRLPACAYFRSVFHLGGILANLKSRLRLLALTIAAALAPAVGMAFDQLDFDVRSDDQNLRAALESASLLKTAKNDGKTDPRDLVAAALADYARLLNTLYAEGYYGGVIHILIDGHEAVNLSPFATPARIGRVAVRIDPGPQFRFAEARVAPRAPNPTATPDFRPGAPARSTAVRDAVVTAAADWRNAGHAMVIVSEQTVIADHRNATLNARITLVPGPLVRFGDFKLTTPSGVRAERIARIAGLPIDQVFSPETLTEVAARLRRTGAFSSVVLTEAETLQPGDRIDIDLALVDAKPHRFGVGAEISSIEGLTLSGFWLHRNLLGGAERLKIEAEISNIRKGMDSIDFSLSSRLEIPAAFGTDTDAYVTTTLQYIDDPAYRLTLGGVEAGIHRRFSDSLEGEIGVAYSDSSSDDGLGHRRISLLSIPGTLTWDRRSDPLDPTSGFYLSGEFEPFRELSGEATGARVWIDGRVYFGLAGDQVVLAGRGLIGSVIGVSAADVPSHHLFYSGGGGTVRGFPYQSLGVELDDGTTIGGRSFLGASGELRYQVNDSFGLVGFADVGHVSASSLFDTNGGTQVSAGVGLRYYTGLGPIRLDVAVPVSGDGGSGAQLYIGIGQSF